MIRSLGNRIAILTLVVLAFSTMAQAAGGGTFRLILEDTTTGLQRVITDNQSNGGILNPNGDKALTTSGLIQFTSSVGNFFVTIYATSAAGADGGGILTLSATVANQSATSGGNFVAFLEDVYGGDSNGATAALTNTIGGYIPGTNTVTDSAGVPTGATLSVQSWLDAEGTVPSFGSNSGPVAATVVAIPGDGPFTNSQPANTLTGSFSTPVVSGTSSPTSIFERVGVNFASSGGTANFTFTAAETNPGSGTSVPEPTSLLLVGSALAGFGIIRKKKQS